MPTLSNLLQLWDSFRVKKNNHSISPLGKIQAALKGNQLAVASL